MKIILPDDIQRLCDEINRCGYNTYIIGSSLRAVVFGYDVDKWDIITSATPDELHSIFNKSEIFSILQMSETEKYGVSVIRSKGQSIELSTMRQDGKYNRYSKKASYTTDIMCDLARRDFTINAIAYDTKDHKIIDFKNGRKDFKKNILKCVMDSNACITEDPVRIYRAFRFAHAYGLKMDKALEKAIDDNIELAKTIPSDRLFEEFNKLMLIKNPGDAIKDLHRHGLFDNIMPEYSKIVGFDQKSRYQIYDLESHTLKTLNGVKPDIELRLAALLHDIGKPVVGFMDRTGEKNYMAHAAAGAAFAEHILGRIGYDKHTVTNVCNLIKLHDSIPCSEELVNDYMDEYGGKFVRDLFELRRADVLAGSRYAITNYLPAISKTLAKLSGVPDDRKVIPLSDLPINGDDIKKYMGVKAPTKEQGIFIGKTLRRCAKEASARPECNNKEFMEAFAKSMIMKNTIPDFVKVDMEQDVTDYSVIRTCDM